MWLGLENLKIISKYNPNFDINNPLNDIERKVYKISEYLEELYFEIIENI